jgi:hypothetical protein
MRKASMNLSERSFSLKEIVKAFPPMITDRNIRIIYDISDAASGTFQGPITYSRWPEMQLPTELVGPTTTTVTASPDFFSYDAAEAADSTTVVWHLNFSHFDLFKYYGSGLFAQDEMQVAEHPVLASLREALRHENMSTLTVEDGKPTPILVRGAERRVHVATNPSASAGRPGGLYGSRFSQAREEVVREAITILNPSTVSNIIAMEAPTVGNGEYTTAQIRYILSTAHTAFRAAKTESETAAPGAKVTIHTGFWGCGAYGGNRQLMTILQFHAARLARIERLVYHTGDKYELSHFKSAVETLQYINGKTTNTESLITYLTKQGFRWGISDGN